MSWYKRVQEDPDLFDTFGNDPYEEESGWWDEDEEIDAWDNDRMMYNQSDFI